MNHKKKNINVGAAILFILFGLLFFVLAGRFLYIQITGEAEGQVLAVKAQEKTLKEKAIEAKRGSIVDRNNNVLAEDTSSYKLVAILDESYSEGSSLPRHVEDPDGTAKKLAKYIDMDESDIKERLSREGLFQVEFGAAGRDISHTVKKQIEALELPGISFIRDTKRFYPNGVFASHVIGYVEKDEEDSKTVGKLGLEKTLDEQLQGKNGKVNYNSDLWGYLLPNSEENITSPEDGNDVTLTLDKKIQAFAEDALNKLQSEYKPAKALAIVMNPKTGEVYAMGQRPSYNPTTKEGLTDSWQNLAIEENYELGSTMKVFTLAAAVEEGVFNPNATYTSGRYDIKGTRGVNDHSGIDKGKTLTYLQGVQRSSNVAFVKIVLEQLGADTFKDYLLKFGFGEKTGIDLPNEVGSKFVYDREIEVATTAYGQGSVFTPIQMMQAFTAIANDGKMMKPYVIDSIVDSNGKTVKKNKPTVAGEPISKETAKKVREYLETVVTSEKATGVKYAIDGYTAAGKTGTSQVVGNTGTYEVGRSNYYFSFIGMAPADDPELIMYIAMDRPDLPNDKTAADGLSTAFKSVMKNSLNYLSIEPEETVTSESASIDDFEGTSAEKAKKTIEDKGLEVIIIGDGKTVVSQAPAAGSVLIEGEKVILFTGGKNTMPDMTGWSLRDVMKVTNTKSLKLNLSGNGYVTKQSIQPGEVFKENDTFIIELQPADPEAQTIEPKGTDEVHD